VGQLQWLTIAAAAAVIRLDIGHTQFFYFFIYAYDDQRRRKFDTYTHALQLLQAYAYICICAHAGAFSLQLCARAYIYVSTLGPRRSAAAGCQCTCDVALANAVDVYDDVNNNIRHSCRLRMVSTAWSMHRVTPCTASASVSAKRPKNLKSKKPRTKKTTGKKMNFEFKPKSMHVPCIWGCVESLITRAHPSAPVLIVFNTLTHPH
jgi:hypothetical protein